MSQFIDPVRRRAILEAAAELAENDLVYADPSDFLHTSLCREEWATLEEIKRIADVVIPKSQKHPGSYVVSQA